MGNYVVIDLEMCKIPKSKRTLDFHWATEIIQIGAVKLDQNYNVIGEFNTYVAPRLGHLTSEISSLTGIQKIDLIGAPDIEAALIEFNKWLPENPIMVAWSDNDRMQIWREIHGKHLSVEALLTYDWIDCQEMFDEKIGAVNSYSLENALNLSDIDYRDGIHNGLVDAYNTSLLFAKLKLEPDFKFNKYYQMLNDYEDEHTPFGSSLGSLLVGINLSAG